MNRREGSWRDGGTKRPAGSWRKPAGEDAAETGESRAWKRSQEAGVDSRRFRNRLVFGFLGLLLVGLVGGFIWFLLLIPQYQVPLVAIAITDVGTQLPPNAYALEDVQRLDLALEQTGNFAVQSTTELTSGPALEDFVAEKLRQEKPSGPDGNTLLLYLSAPAIVTAEGAPCLIVGDPDRSDNLVPMRSLINQVTQKANSDPDLLVLLILESKPVKLAPQLGVLQDRFAEALEALVDQDNTENLLVLHCAEPGQNSWSSPGIGGTLFGYFVAAGLAGAADGQLRDDKQISVEELYLYVRSHVAQAAKQQFDAEQTPILLPRDAPRSQRDAPIAHRGTFTGLPASSQDLKSLLTQMSNLWNRHAQLRAEAAYRLDGPKWAELEARILRLERLMMAGKAYRDQFTSTLADTEKLAESFSPSRPVITAVGALDIDDTRATQLDQHLRVWLENQQIPEVDKRQPLPAISRSEAAHAIMRYLEREHEAGRPCTLTQIQALLPYHDESEVKSGSDPQHDLAEVQLLKIYQRFADWNSAAEPVRTSLAPILKNRRLAETLASAQDPRPRHWLDQPVSQYEQSMRQLEDQMLLLGGDSVSLEPEADRVMARLQAAEGYAKTLARAYQLRDEAWATLPHWASWTWDQAGTAEFTLLRDTWNTTCQAAHRLGKLLEEGQGSATFQSTLDELPGTMQAVRTGLDGLLRGYQDRCNDLLLSEGSDSGATRRRIREVLALPLILADNRSELWEDLLRSETRNQQEADWLQAAKILPLKTAASGEPAAQPQLAKRDADQEAWQPSPFSQLLDTQYVDLDLAAAPEPSSDLARHAKEVQRRLQGLPEQLESRVTESEREMTREGVSPVSAIKPLRDADRLIRPVAIWLTHRGGDERLRVQDATLDLSDTRSNPCVQLWRAERYYHELSQAARRLDDCWNSTTQGQPYFAIVARRLLNDAQQTFTLRSQLDRQLRERLTQQLQAVQQFAFDYDATEVLIPPRQTQTLPYRVKVQAAEPLPPGRVAFFVSRLSGQLEPVLDQNDQPLDKRPAEIQDLKQSVAFEHSFRRDAAVLADGQLQYTLLWRGFQVTSPIGIREAEAGIAVTARFPEPAGAKVRVIGQPELPARVMFVFDLSESMWRPAPGFGQSPRIDVAIDALGQLMDQFDANSRLQIGLMTFRWDPQQGDLFVPSVPMGRMIYVDGNGNRIDRRNSILSTLKRQVKQPAGTPLYAAVRAAISKFTSDSQAPRHVVVITDGNDSGHSIDAATLENELKKPENREVRLDIIGMGLPKVDAFVKLAQLQGGQYRSAGNARELADVLKDSIQKVKYFVGPEGQKPSEGQLKFLGVPFEFGKAEFAQDLQAVLNIGAERLTRNVWLEGGEDVEIRLSSETGQLVFPEYDHEVRGRDVIARHPRTGEPFVIRNHIPQHGNNEVMFRVSFQRQDVTRFTKRPRAAWAEITPEKLESPRYVLYDLEWIPNTPVPMLGLRAARWPNFRRARIQVWFLDDSVDLASRFKPFKLTTAQLENKYQIKDDQTIPGVTLHLEGQPTTEGNAYKIVVTEDHAHGTTLGTVCLGLSPRPTEVRRSTFVEAGEVRHEFIYKSRDFLKSHLPILNVSTKEKLTQDAIYADFPDVIVQGL